MNTDLQTSENVEAATFSTDASGLEECVAPLHTRLRPACPNSPARDTRSPACRTARWVERRATLGCTPLGDKSG